MNVETVPVPASTEPAMLLGIRRVALVEIALYLGLALLVDALLLGGDRFWLIEPHPFWPIIILISAQYGTREGLVATGAATLALLAGNLPERAITEDLYQYSFGLLIRPALWLMMSVLVGEIRIRHLRERDGLRGRLQIAEGQGVELMDAYRRVSQVRDALETRVAGQVRTAMTMYQAARAMEKRDPTEVLLGVMDVVRAVLNPKKFSIYLLEGQNLEISVGEGWDPADTLSRAFTSESGLFRAVIGEQRALCAVNRQEELILGNQGVLAGPLKDNESGQVIGMLKIEQMGFLDLHFSNVQTFNVVCEWIADSYVNASRYQLAQADSLTNQETQLLTYSFFERQRDWLIELAKRLDFDVSMVLIRLENPEDLNDQETRLLPVLFRDTVRQYFRLTDMTYDYQRTAVQYCALLPATDHAGAEIVAGRLREALEPQVTARVADARVAISVHTVYKRKGREDV